MITRIINYRNVPGASPPARFAELTRVELYFKFMH